MSKTRILTGITTSGTPHLGNFAGAIRPAIQSSLAADAESFFFLADYHALVKAQDAGRLQQSTLEIAATWLAAGLDTSRVWFYRQSDIPEIAELTWFLTCVTGKGLLNRAHAYKAANDRNRELGEDDDAGITAGLYMYPVLMAADILMFNANKVPVGRDQIQHIEMARDIGQRFNHIYGEEFFVLPEAVIAEEVATLPGLDGRKMSKSYNNTIPMFIPSAQMRKLIAAIVTDSRLPGEPKETENNAIVDLYRAFSGAAQAQAFENSLREGLGWGDAKQQLFEQLDAAIAPMRAHYDELIADPAQIEKILRENGARLREQYAVPMMQRLRGAVGIRDLGGGAAKPAGKKSGPQKSAVSIKQYRGEDGQFYFKIQNQDEVLFASRGYATPKEVGSIIADLKSGSLAASRLQEMGETLADGLEQALPALIVTP